MSEEFPTISIDKKDLSSNRFSSLEEMFSFVRMRTSLLGLRYDRPHKIGIKTWSEDGCMKFKNYNIENTIRID